MQKLKGKQLFAWLAAAGAGTAAAWWLWPSAALPSARKRASVVPPMLPADVAALPKGWTPKSYADAIAKAGLPTLSEGNKPAPQVPPWVEDLWVAQQATFKARRRAILSTLIDGKFQGKSDPAYARYYAAPWVPVFGYEVGWRWLRLNRNGLGMPGTSADPFGVLLNVAGLALPMIPGIGSAANAALQTAIALGKGKSLSDAALAGARGALPPWGQVAFDLGVGVATGKPVDQAAVDTALKYLAEHEPQAYASYQQGKALAKGLK